MSIPIKLLTFVFLFVKFNFFVVFLSRVATNEECIIPNEESRQTCVNISTNSPITSPDQCQSVGCCWNEHSKVNKCYDINRCIVGLYGWMCHLKCSCSKSAPCDRLTGVCQTSCPDGRWGVGCLLDNSCSYNDPGDFTYVGSRKVANNNQACLPWYRVMNPNIIYFYDYELDSKVTHKTLFNFCRNPNLPTGKNMQGAWCYVRRKNKINENEVKLCSLNSCECPVGLYGSSCMHQCHCRDVQERCDGVTGDCPISGCHERWMDGTCSECTRGYFGVYCEKRCRCRQPGEVCDKSNGYCESGCTSGWMGPSCQSECEDRTFGLNCEYTCNCEQASEVCNKSTGACRSGCRRGFGGEGCQLSLPRLVRKPQVFSKNSTSVHLQWRSWNSPGAGEGQGPIIGYQVFVRRAGAFAGMDGWMEGSGIVVETNAVVTSLSMETSFDFHVVVMRSDLAGLPSPILTTSTCGYPKGAVNITSSKMISKKHILQNNNININMNNYMFLRWAAPKLDSIKCSKVLHYNVYVSNSTSPSPSSLHATTNTTSAEVHITDIYTNLTISVTYHNNALLESPHASVSYTGKSQQVDSLDIFNSTSTSLCVTWKPPKTSNGPVDIYVVSYQPIKSEGCQNDVITQSWITPEPVPGTENKIEIFDLSIFTTYQIKVCPVTFAGQGQEKVITGETDATEPSGKVNMTMKKLKSTSASFMLQPVSCQHWNGHFKGYAYKLYQQLQQQVGDVINNDPLNGNEDLYSSNKTDNSNNNYDNNMDDDDLENSAWSLVAESWIDGTKLDLESLVPFTNYTVQVWFANHKFNGSKHNVQFETPEDIPPPPKNLKLVNTTHTSLYVTWDPPRPTHGIIVAYHIMLSNEASKTSSSSNKMENGNSSEEVIPIMSGHVTSHNITQLHPYINYMVQVRASTSEGHGAWSEAIHALTDESIPTEPQHLQNTSRSSHDFTLLWHPPLRKNGVLISYTVTCNPVTKSKSRTLERVLEPEKTSIIINELQPGTNYDCKVFASTKAGRGQFAELLLWTEPRISFDMPAPRLRQASKEDSMILLELDAMQEMNHMEEADILNRIVVQIFNPMHFSPSSSDKARKKKRKKRNLAQPLSSSGSSSPSLVTSSTPCDLTYNELTDYLTARSLGHSCYIAAEIPRITQARTFAVGDNKTYGGYYNAKLEPQLEHEVWFGLVVTVDGMTVSSYSKNAIFSKSHRMNQGFHHPSSSSSSSDLQNDDDDVARDAFDSSSSSSSSSATITAVVVGSCLALALVIILVALVAYNCKLLRARKLMKELHAPPVAEGHAADVDDCDDDDDDPQYSDDVQLNKILLSDPSELKVTSSSKLHPPIPVSELWNFVVPRKQYVDDKIRKEFNELKQNVIFKATASCRAENRSKNRYCNVLAYDHSRVVLRCSPHQSDYINANYIDGFNKAKAYVACQGPTRSTVNDFWRMVWQLNARIILMVTNLVENGRHKCDIYWPDAGSSKYGDVVVQLKHLEGYADYKIRTFAVASSSNGAETREVIQLHFTTWPDNGVPLHPTALLEFRKRVKNIETKNIEIKNIELMNSQLYENSDVIINSVNNNLQQKLLGGVQEKITNKNDVNFTEHPVVVHCSAGVGRTGTYIALDSLLEQAEQEKRVDVFGCVNNMRNQRVNMVQTVEQYIFIYDALLEALEKSSATVISCSEFRRRYAELVAVDPATNMSHLHREFVSLQSKNVLYSHDDDDDEGDDDFDDDNFDGDGDDDYNEKIATKKQKNVGAKIALKKKKRPKKMKKAVREEPRAVLVDGYRQKAAFLVMQTPLTRPAIDYFWSVILQHKCGAIISFDDEDEAEDFIPYCPKVERSKDSSEGYETAETFTAGSFSIQTISSSSSSVAPSPGSCADHPLCFNEQEFILSFKPSATNNQNNEIIIKRFSMNNWRRKSKTTSSGNKNAKPPTATSSAKNLTNNDNKINHNTKRSDNDDNAHHVGDDNDTQKRDDDDNGICDDDGHDDNLPRRFTILTLLSSLEKWQQKTGNNTVLVHCRNGTRYSGLFCTASYLIERLKIEHEVDMYMAVRYIRVNRHQFVPSLVQYDYLYKLIIDYLDSFDTYANFESSI